MGTRSLTVFMNDPFEGKEKEIAVLYRQMDGYPSGHGLDLVKILKGRKIINGIDAGDEHNFNGMENLAVMVIGELERDYGFQAGGFYLNPAKTRGCGEEYIYTIRNKDGKPYITMTDIYNKTKISGFADELKEKFKEK